MTPFELRQLVEYDPETGSLIWKQRDGNARLNSKLAGKPAFAQLSDGYLTGRIKGKNYKAHRIAWAVAYGEWPQGQIDHINGDRSDNRLPNLRVVSNSENGKHCGPNAAWVAVTHIPTMISARAYDRHHRLARERAIACVELMVADCRDAECQFPERVAQEDTPNDR